MNENEKFNQQISRFINKPAALFNSLVNVSPMRNEGELKKLIDLSQEKNIDIFPAISELIKRHLHIRPEEYLVIYEKAANHNCSKQVIEDLCDININENYKTQFLKVLKIQLILIDTLKDKNQVISAYKKILKLEDSPKTQKMILSHWTKNYGIVEEIKDLVKTQIKGSPILEINPRTFYEVNVDCAMITQKSNQNNSTAKANISTVQVKMQEFINQIDSSFEDLIYIKNTSNTKMVIMCETSNKALKVQAFVDEFVNKSINEKFFINKKGFVPITQITKNPLSLSELKIIDSYMDMQNVIAQKETNSKKNKI